MQKTTFVTKENAERNWVLVDLDGKILGRVASLIANILRGKNKALYTPHIDTGDFVVAINAEKIKLTGKKLTDKIYYSHSGYKGGLKEVPAGKMLQRKPIELIRRAVAGMLPKNKMRDHLLKKLKIYPAQDHPHQAQQPKVLEIN